MKTARNEPVVDTTLLGYSRKKAQQVRGLQSRKTLTLAIAIYLKDIISKLPSKAIFLPMR